VGDAAAIRLDGVDKRFAGGTLALRGVSMAVGASEFVALLGPSGCGKSTVLRLAAGLEAASAGTLHAPATLQPEAAQTAFVFQEPTLMPWARVIDNVALPLRLAGHGRAQARDAARAMLHGVGLAEFAEAYPAQLSGGMKMRVSIARALVTQPRVLLMDEPFAALDEITRGRLNDDLLLWWRARPLAALFVTHSVYEAVYLAQRVLVMSARPGRIVAEVAVDAPYPREPGFRTAAYFGARCRELSAALESAHGEA
jgi:NitT/TauT family transport system ATP-binding protein